MEINVNIRRAKQKDILQCLKLLRNKSTTLTDGNSPNQSILKSYLTKGIFYVAELNKNVVGCIVGECLIENGAVIWFFVVDSKYRQLGVGSKLIEKFEEHKSWIFLTSYLSSKDANKFYAKHNYIKGEKCYEFIKIK
jgi:ribosomal protein S18 acetylase RimI-like enzyme